MAPGSWGVRVPPAGHQGTPLPCPGPAPRAPLSPGLTLHPHPPAATLSLCLSLRTGRPHSLRPWTLSARAPQWTLADSRHGGCRGRPFFAPPESSFPCRQDEGERGVCEHKLIHAGWERVSGKYPDIPISTAPLLSGPQVPRCPYLHIELLPPRALSLLSPQARPTSSVSSSSTM